jgi:hypothetical protein
MSAQTNVLFEATSKDSYERLRAPIRRMRPLLKPRSFLPISAGLYYINAYGHEIHPVPTPEYISGLGSNEVLVYSCGSLWTR